MKKLNPLKNIRNSDQPENNFAAPSVHKKPSRAHSEFLIVNKPAIQTPQYQGQYCIPTSPLQAKVNLKKKKTPNLQKNNGKSKSNKKQAYMSSNLKNQLKQSSNAFSKIFSKNIEYCKSARQLKEITNHRNAQMKCQIAEKANLMSDKQQFKEKDSKFRLEQQELVQKTIDQQYQIISLKENLKLKEQLLVSMEKNHQLQIDRIKLKHQQEIAYFKEEIQKIKAEAILNKNFPNFLPSTQQTDQNSSEHSPKIQTSLSINQNINIQNTTHQSPPLPLAEKEIQVEQKQDHKQSIGKDRLQKRTHSPANQKKKKIMSSILENKSRIRYSSNNSKFVPETTTFEERQIQSNRFHNNLNQAVLNDQQKSDAKVWEQNDPAFKIFTKDCLKGQK